MSDLPVLSGVVPAIIDTTTGEALEFAGATEAQLAAVTDAGLAHCVDALKLAQSQLREARSIVERELLSRMPGATRKLDAGSFGIKRTEKREWDPAATLAALNDLITSGLVDQSEAQEAMPEKSKRVPDGRKLNALLGRLVADDPVAASPLARARKATPGVEVVRRALESTAVEVES